MAEGQIRKRNENIIDAIYRHPLFQEHYKRLECAEQDRRFCRHQMNHLLDVARIAYIQNLEEGLGFPKEMIYAAALLHDIGKARQYEEGIPHEIVSAEIAEVILRDISRGRQENSAEKRENGNVRKSKPETDTPQNSQIQVFTEEEQREILRAIRGHRKFREDMTPFEKLLYTSDKKSRQCFACPAESECNWSLEKKNMEIEI